MNEYFFQFSKDPSDDNSLVWNTIKEFNLKPLDGWEIGVSSFFFPRLIVSHKDDEIKFEKILNNEKIKKNKTINLEVFTSLCLEDSKNALTYSDSYFEKEYDQIENFPSAFDTFLTNIENENNVIKLSIASETVINFKFSSTATYTLNNIIFKVLQAAKDVNVDSIKLHRMYKSFKTYVTEIVKPLILKDENYSKIFMKSNLVKGDLYTISKIENDRGYIHNENRDYHLLIIDKIEKFKDYKVRFLTDNNKIMTFLKNSNETVRLILHLRKRDTLLKNKDVESKKDLKSKSSPDEMYSTFNIWAEIFSEQYSIFKEFNSMITNNHTYSIDESKATIQKFKDLIDVFDNLLKNIKQHHSKEKETFDKINSIQNNLHQNVSTQSITLKHTLESFEKINSTQNNLYQKFSTQNDILKIALDSLEKSKNIFQKQEKIFDEFLEKQVNFNNNIVQHSEFLLKLTDSSKEIFEKQNKFYDNILKASPNTINNKEMFEKQIKMFDKILNSPAPVNNIEMFDGIVSVQKNLNDSINKQSEVFNKILSTSNINNTDNFVEIISVQKILNENINKQNEIFNKLMNSPNILEEINTVQKNLSENIIKQNLVFDKILNASLNPCNANNNSLDILTEINSVQKHLNENINRQNDVFDKILESLKISSFSGNIDNSSTNGLIEINSVQKSLNENIIKQNEVFNKILNSSNISNTNIDVLEKINSIQIDLNENINKQNEVFDKILNASSFSNNSTEKLEEINSVQKILSEHIDKQNQALINLLETYDKSNDNTNFNNILTQHEKFLSQITQNSSEMFEKQNQVIDQILNEISKQTTVPEHRPHYEALSQTREPIPTNPPKRAKTDFPIKRFKSIINFDDAI